MRSMPLILLSLATGLFPGLAYSAQRFAIDGHVSVAVASQGIYRIGYDSTSDAASFPKSQASQISTERFRFKDPDGLLVTTLGGTLTFQPGWYRLVLEVAESGTADVIECVVLSAKAMNSIAPPESRTTRPDLFAGPANRLYPSVDAPVFREPEFDLDDLDSDSDGFSNLKDAFPNDPTENRDSDGDNIGNNADPDDDNDLMTDVYEMANGLNPTQDDATGDLDGDERSNFAEFVTGTAANNGASFFRLRIEPNPTAPPAWQLSFPVVAGRTYQLKSGTSLSSPLVPLGTPITVTTDGIQEVFQSSSTRRFFTVEANLTTP